ncbi:hypothetical protein BpHYR1_050731 [Brachionus plicatilis]|uniref:HTH CENPB-type domain-containing protein n=1 Tax=Brachionus plicatilis TaxID=10195 RepID=A0A3M7PQL8_BRAPC|nr:hypothetical protein BpHYR1_050731 [Brachionus plicatilis]
MENELLAWFDLERLNKRSVSGFDIKHKALEIHQRIYSNILAQNPFQASDGWLYGWLERNSKTYRRVTTTGRDLPNNYMQII